MLKMGASATARPFVGLNTASALDAAHIAIFGCQRVFYPDGRPLGTGSDFAFQHHEGRMPRRGGMFKARLGARNFKLYHYPKSGLLAPQPK